MQHLDPTHLLPNPPILSADELRRRLGELHPLQIQAWRQMTPAQRSKIAFQAYRFALQVVRTAERRSHPNLPAMELAWRVTRRMQGNSRLGKRSHGT